MINALGDTMTTYKNKYGQEVSRISLIQTERIKDFLAIESKDSIIQKLQREVKANKGRIKDNGSVTVITNTTDIDTSGATEITYRDTITINDTVYIYPEYSFGIKSKWITANTKANKDSTYLDLSIENAYTVVLGSERPKGFKNLFKPKVAFAEVTNENPYTSTQTIRAYKVQAPKPKRLGIGFNVGYGLILNSKPIFRPYIGIGIQYNIIEIL